VQERVDQRRKGVPVYGAKQLQYLLSNTRAVRTEEKDKINEWSERLRQLRHEATVWGDSDEAELLNALLALAKDRLASVGPDNRYAHPYHQLQQHLGAREESLLEWIERKSLEVSCEVPQLLRDWRRKLAECAELAVLWRQHREEEFYRGLLELLGGQPASLPEGHVYARSLAYVAAARAAGLRPPAIATRDVRLMFSTVRDGGPSEPERRDSVRTKLSKLLAEARSDGDRDELEFFEALLAMLEGGRREMSPKNGYRIYLESRMGERL
jgi:hypothetical protein